MLRRILGICIIVAGTTALFAQMGRWGGGEQLSPDQMAARRVAHLTALLNLNATQQTQATTIFTKEQTTLSGMKSQRQAAMTALKTAVQKNDTAEIHAQSVTLGNLAQRGVETRATAEAAFYATLTQTQQNTYNAAKQERMGRWRRPDSE
jgi:Spy/CpxP family protein refolding chaperone